MIMSSSNKPQTYESIYSLREATRKTLDAKFANFIVDTSYICWLKTDNGAIPYYKDPEALLLCLIHSEELEGRVFFRLPQRDYLGVPIELKEDTEDFEIFKGNTYSEQVRDKARLIYTLKHLNFLYSPLEMIVYTRTPISFPDALLFGLMSNLSKAELYGQRWVDFTVSDYLRQCEQCRFIDILHPQISGETFLPLKEWKRIFGDNFKNITKGLQSRSVYYSPIKKTIRGFTLNELLRHTNELGFHIRFLEEKRKNKNKPVPEKKILKTKNKILGQREIFS